MLVEVFDDRKGSVMHILAGGLTYFVHFVFVIFIAYEFIEHIYLKGKEKEANFLGDIFEFSFGVMLAVVLTAIMGYIGWVVFVIFVAALWVLMGRWEEG